jgi:predicted RNA-binding protein with RPS1 domain
VKVLQLKDYGAYVQLPNGMPALLHISAISHERIKEVKDVLAVGQEFDVMCMGRDTKGIIELSRKALLEKPPVEKGKEAGGAQQEKIHEEEKQQQQ